MCDPQALLWEVNTEVTTLNYRILNSLTSAPTCRRLHITDTPAMRIVVILRRFTTSEHSIFFLFGSPSVRRLVLRPASSQLVAI
jgi:hypothetical protein